MALTIQQRKKRLLLTGLAGVLLTAGIVVLLNVLANWFFLRFDMTQQKTYSLSPASRKLVKELSDRVVIKAYFTPDLPPPYNIFERYTRDLLTEYRSASGGKVHFQFEFTSPPAEFEKKAGEAGLAPIQFQQMGSNQLQIRRGYMGMVLYHRDKTEVIPIMKNIEQLEYELTSRIAKLAVRQKKVIAVTSGHGETEWVGSRAKLAGDLGDSYDFKTVALPQASTSPIMADALVIIGPRQKLDEASLRAVDDAVMRGIPVAFFVDIRNFIPGRFFVAPQDAGLHGLLKQYGVQLGDRLIYDYQCESINVTQSVAGFAIPVSLNYPYIPLVDRILNTHPVGRNVEAVALPFVTSVDPVNPMPASVHFKPLLFTTQKSYFADDLVAGSVAPNDLPQPKADGARGPFPVGAVLDGTFTSAYQSKTSPNNQIFVLGTSRIFDPDLSGLTGAESLVSNVLAYLSKDETLIGIRNKGEIIRPLKPLTNTQQRLVKYGTILASTMLPVLLGLWCWRRRQAWRIQTAATFAPRAGT